MTWQPYPSIINFPVHLLDGKFHIMLTLEAQVTQLMNSRDTKNCWWVVPTDFEALMIWIRLAFVLCQ